MIILKNSIDFNFDKKNIKLIILTNISVYLGLYVIILIVSRIESTSNEYLPVYLIRLISQIGMHLIKIIIYSCFLSPRDIIAAIKFTLFSIFTGFAIGCLVCIGISSLIGNY